MRRFVIVGHKASTSGDFKLDDMAGGAGRLDILLRCVNSTFFLSHGIRKDAEIYLVLQGPPTPPRTIRISGQEIRYLNPDERSTGALVRNALLKDMVGEETKSSPGIYVSKRPLEDVLKDLASKSKLVYLKETGEDVRGRKFEGDVTFVISDHQDLTAQEEELLLTFDPDIITLGPLSLHADHCIILVHSEMDRAAPDKELGA
ncbi:tRNA (pseudouridine(54)-N(1))-methyltransferase TrmY [Methanomassiliicoccus luminyensis]|uniref:tRNA (pseudouridine(54)-N(1))-methyltransferase TrmY n=1 Tax=Methanomassiliicoccus luminyensis TaxID=1080712 RepID=UPI000374F619|nr:tRNA (pseudouridine(54)-N(1))-methyltransferase TrmY [Methanomassiliicoccus luminyensis]